MQKTLLFLIALITIINYFDRGAIAYTFLPLHHELGISREEFGYLGSAFGLGYLCMSFFSGKLVDRYGPLRVWSISSVLWSFFVAILGICNSFWSLFTFRVLLGVAEAAHFPCLLKVSARWLKPKWRARSISIGLLGVPLSTVLGAPFVSFLIAQFSWRIMFFILGVLGWIWACVWFALFKKREIHYDAENSSAISLKALFQESRIFLGNAFNFFIFGYVIFFLLFWLPTYFEQRYHTKIMGTGYLVATPWIFSCFSVLLGGVVSDAIKRKTGSIYFARTLPIGLALLLSGISLFLMTLAHDSLFWESLFLIIALSATMFANAPIFSLNADLFPSREGSAQGVITFFFALAGIVAPSVTGMIIHATRHYTNAFYFASALCFIGFLISITLQRKR